MNILLVGKGISNESLMKVLSKDNNVTFAIEENEKLDKDSIYKKDVNIDEYDYFYIAPGVPNNDELYQKLLSCFLPY